MRYAYNIENNKGYKITSPQFPDIMGKGSNEDKAWDHFITSVFDHIRNTLKSDNALPNEINKTPKGYKSFGLPLNMTLKLKLHNARVSKDVSTTELAGLLSITHDDVPDGNWSLENLKTIKPKAAPKYKNVDRLINIDHESTVREIEQAFRVLGFNVNVNPYERSK